MNIRRGRRTRARGRRDRVSSGELLAALDAELGPRGELGAALRAEQSEPRAAFGAELLSLVLASAVGAEAEAHQILNRRTASRTVLELHSGSLWHCFHLSSTGRINQASI